MDAEASLSRNISLNNSTETMMSSAAYNVYHECLQRLQVRFIQVVCFDNGLIEASFVLVKKGLSIVRRQL